MKSIYTVLRKPLFTEKGSSLKEEHNKILVEVAKDANKLDIKKAIEDLFKVKVEKIATINTQGKWKRYGKFIGKKPSRKKAIITLKTGEKLEFIEGA
jgi:large subunit ribosomal protein L23